MSATPSKNGRIMREVIVSGPASQLESFRLLSPPARRAYVWMLCQFAMKGQSRGMFAGKPVWAVAASLNHLIRAGAAEIVLDDEGLPTLGVVNGLVVASVH